MKKNFDDYSDKLEIFVDATGMIVMAQNMKTYIKAGKKISAVITGTAMLATAGIIMLKAKQIRDRKKNETNEQEVNEQEVELCKGEVVDIKKIG